MFLGFFVVLLCSFDKILNHTIRFRACHPPTICTSIRNCQNFLPFIMKQSYCGFDNNFLKVCCLEQNLTTTTTTSAPRVVRKNQRTIINHKNFRLLPVERCGEVSSRLRITSGASTSPGEFPWMTLIAYRIGNSNLFKDFKCAGTLINKNHVLTAAHCIDNSTILGVRLGEYDLNTDPDCDATDQFCKTPVQDLSIGQIITHSLYDPDSFVNDIALIKLATSANYSYGNVQPICLPFDELLNTNLEGLNLTVAGWGKTDEGERSTTLRKVTVPVLPFSRCQALYASVKNITRKQLCAGGVEGRDSCAGDSGGPLKTVHYVNSSPRYVQYGIVSFGPSRCGLSTRPGVYTNVQKYMSWILDNLSE